MGISRYQKGQLYKQSKLWKLRYYMDVVADDGTLKRVRANPEVIGRAEGPGRLTKAQAEAIRAEMMGIVNGASHRPGSAITFADYVEKQFPAHLATVRKATAKSYRDKLKWILPVIGALPMRDVRTGHIQKLLNSMAERGFARTTIVNTKRVASTVFNIADDTGHFVGRNPAARAKVPVAAKRSEPVRGYSVKEMTKLLAALSTPLQEMCALGCSTSMHGAELAGLRIEHLNFSNRPREIAGRVVRPNALIVCESYALNQRTEPKNGHRVRVLPIPEALRDALFKLAAGRPPADPLFVMPQSLKRGKIRPVDTGNVTSRIFSPLSKRLGIKVNWHRLRHTNATWAHEMLLDGDDRAAMMGHWSVQTTDQHYTDQFERQKRVADAIMAKIWGKEEGGVQ